MRGYGAVIAVVAALIAIFGGIFWMAGAKERQALTLCDDAIKATLKAPATYQRVELPFGTTSPIQIVYDAENSFGVPLRSKGWCSIKDNGARAEWSELPDSLK